MVRATLGFLGGTAVGGLIALVSLTALYVALPGVRDDGPPTILQAGAPAAAGETKVIRRADKRLLQRCRGACDDFRL